MRGPAATPAGEDDAPRGRELYQTGPWLVIFGHGTRSEVCAQQVVERCHLRGVHLDVAPVDEAARLDLSYYTALIVVLPSTPFHDRPASSMDGIVEIIKAYRARRPVGLSSLLDGSRRWFQVGVVQVFSTHDADAHVCLKPIMSRICLVHHVHDDETIDPFGIYQAHGRLALPRPGSSDRFAHDAGWLQSYLRSWGFSVPEEVSRARAIIDECRRRYEDPRFTALHRPIPGRNRNRLDFLLDEPETRGPGHKKWMENGARVTRDVFGELEREFSGFHRPSDRDNKKEAQKDLRNLYHALLAIEAIMKVQDQGTSNS